MDYHDLIEPEFLKAHSIVSPISMQTPERLYALYNAVRFVVQGGIEGDLVEAGVWKGASVMMIALVLKYMGVTDRDIWLYDTFDGMTPPTDVDINRDGVKVQELLNKSDKSERIWAYAPIDEVRANLEYTGYPMERFKFIQGDVVQTLPLHKPTKISLLRLDTDWYESTKAEMEHLYPLLSPRGVLIIDDYGCYRGSRKAVDDYFAPIKEAYLLQRVDPSCRMMIKA